MSLETKPTDPYPIEELEEAYQDVKFWKDKVTAATRERDRLAGLLKGAGETLAKEEAGLAAARAKFAKVSQNVKP